MEYEMSKNVVLLFDDKFEYAARTITDLNGKTYDDFTFKRFYESPPALEDIKTNSAFAAVVQYNLGENKKLEQNEQSFSNYIIGKYDPDYKTPYAQKAMGEMSGFLMKLKETSPQTKRIVVMEGEKQSLTHYLLSDLDCHWTLTNEHISSLPLFLDILNLLQITRQRG